MPQSQQTKSLSSRLRRLTPTNFENLVYDLLIKRGLENVRWRTPGADGGRDIEGTYSVVDFSGTATVETWYVECKRYSASIGWPLLYEKITYAANHGVDFLLLCTTAVTSPKCKDEIAKWNDARRVPLVRVWERPELERLLQNDQQLLRKYGLDPTVKVQSGTPSELLALLVRTADSVYGEAVYKGSASASVEFAASLAEFIAVTAEDPPGGIPSASRSLVPSRDLYGWCAVDDKTDWTGWGSYTVRALVCAVRFYTKASRLELVVSSDGREVRIETNGADLPTLSKALNGLTLAADLEWNRDTTGIVIRRRNGKPA